MPDDDAISISSDEEQVRPYDRKANLDLDLAALDENPKTFFEFVKRDRRVERRSTVFAPVIHNVISALGGLEAGEYRLGDEAYGCLKDLKKFWRKDDTDDERTVAHLFWEARLLSNDLIPILLETAGKGAVEDKCAIAVADLITAMTWPIDLAEELKELDDEFDQGTDYTQLLLSHLSYKAALLQKGVLQALLGIMLPCLAKEKKARTERDGQIVNVVLHLFRNLAFIKDRPANRHASVDDAEYSTLQSKYIRALSEAHILDLLMTIASNATQDTFFNQWNTLVMEIFYLLFRGVSPSLLALDQEKRTKDNLAKLLEAENKVKLENTRHASSRHSRFGTTISVRLNNKKTADKDTNDAGDASAVADRPIVLHRQKALSSETGVILDLKKKKIKGATKKADEFGAEISLSVESKAILQNVARTFIETCFNPFLGSVLKDIKSERPKITEKDHLRLLFVVKWFLEFFLAVREQAKLSAKSGRNTTMWDFAVIGEVVERSWIVWILKRMRGAMDEKPKLWIELQAGIECLNQLLLLIDNLSASEIADADLNEAAEVLQQQIIYNGEVLDLSVDSLRSYKEGVQSLRYLDSSIRLGYSLLRMLERWAKARGNNELYVRKRKAARSRKKKTQDEDDEENTNMMQEDVDDTIHEVIFTFDTFEAKFAHEDITHTLVTYLSRYEEFKEPEQMKRVVNLLHRQAVKSKAEGLFFKVSTLNLFKILLSSQKSFPNERPYKDLVSLINYILRQFFKAVDKEPFLIVESFFPKSRGRWKQFSSWEPEAKSSKRDRNEAKDNKHPAEVQVKRGYSWSEQLGIAIACLIENDQRDLIDWTREILALVIAQRKRIIEEVDGSSSQSQLDDDDIDGNAEKAAATRLRHPSNEAMAKLEDYLIPYLSDEHADAATKNPHLKLVFRLVKFYILDDNADELEWYIPAAILPSELQSSLNVINQFLETPLDLNGKKASQLISKKTRRRRRKAVASDDEGVALPSDADDEEPKKRKAKKKKEQVQYKSAQFIEDSDAEYGDDEAFWARERAARERTARAAAEGKIASMRSSGTKKRKRPASGKTSKRRTLEEALSVSKGDEILEGDEKSDDDNSSKGSDEESGQSGSEKGARNETPDIDPQRDAAPSKPTKGKSRIVVSDEE